jgi:Mn2+/Fe2+ NRAMP family transporter
VTAPPLLVVVMLVSNNRKVMGDRANGLLTNILGWLAAAVMFAAAIAMFLTWNS